VGAILTLTETQRTDVRRQFFYVSPALIAGGAAWLLFLTFGETPLVRASGLALVICGMAMLLRPMGAVLSIIGALALAICPAFWSQTGGTETYNSTLFVAALVIAALISSGVLVYSKSAALAIATAAALMIGFFLISQGIGGTRSLRLTTLLTVSLLYLLLDALLVSNPRPDSPPTGQLHPYHSVFLLGVFGLGVVNDPLFVLFAPALALGLFLSRATLPLWYWLMLITFILFGGIRLAQVYISADFWVFSAQRALEVQLRTPFLIADAWRNPTRWFDLLSLLTNQFTIVGLALAILGLARLSRWYPPIGVVTMFAFGAYAVFGLLYFGGDREVLLLPLLMIQVLWMTYALSTFQQWVVKWRKRNDSK
jgi:hypothetical protein